ncbi:hypothetical protein KSP39_PZI001526 [Platanthera zijinensis]|uniref:Uncharacterized protein n=1 Tax=Platanthera zijinensis TaxID=2320716 RepID=A0AAP0C283_9ASPA
MIRYILYFMIFFIHIQVDMSNVFFFTGMIEVLTRLDRIRNECITHKIEVAPMAEKMREARLKCCGHVQRIPLETPVGRCDSLLTTYVKRGRGRPTKTWNETIRKDKMYLSITKRL